MSREDLKEIIGRVLVRLQQQAPRPACLWVDDPEPCDTTTRYGINEEA